VVYRELRFQSIGGQGAAGRKYARAVDEDVDPSRRSRKAFREDEDFPKRRKVRQLVTGRRSARALSFQAYRSARRLRAVGVAAYAYDPAFEAGQNPGGR